VRGAGAWLMLTGSGQGGHLQAPLNESILLVVALVVLSAACVAIALSLSRRERPRAVSNQWEALAVMGELCPHGWQAHITLYGWGAPIPSDAPPARVPQVELEWKQFDEEPGRIAVARRLWAPTIGEALQAMVDDRRTDLTFEQIEQAAAEADGTSWSD